MPHTSHKKKQVRSKRQEVVSEDGWTRITSSKPVDMPLMRRSEAVMVMDVDEAPEGLVVSDIHAKYVEMERRWKASKSWNSMADILKTRAIGSDARIDACVLFGSGTFTGLRDGWIKRSHVAFCQLAAFKAVIDLIENCTGQRPAAYAQEPRYNAQDGAFLSTLGVQKIEDPNGFDLLTNHSFAFCPGAEQYVVLETLEADPFLYLGGQLDSFPGGYHYLQPRSNISPKDPQGGGKPSVTSRDRIEEPVDKTREDSPAKIDEARVGSRRANQLPDEQEVIERFLRNKEAAKVPDFDLQDQPVYNTWLYWPRPSN